MVHIGIKYIVWCLLFVLIRHGEEGATSLHAGLERLGKETGYGGAYFLYYCKYGMILFFDCWWALFGNRAAENNNEGHSVY